MEGFKRIVKMKTGGSVSKAISAYEKKERKVEEKADIAQDKAIVKKAISIHDKQEHKGEKTDLSKLKKGGRAKKELGSVRKFEKAPKAPSAAVKAKNTTKKFKDGGKVTNVYEAKKKSGDKDAIKKVKQITPTKAAAPSKAAVKAKNTPAKFCAGKSVKKYAPGGSVDVKDPQALTDKIALEENTADRELMMRPLRALKNMATGAAKKFMGQGAVTDAERAAAPSAPVNQSGGSNINRKKGGKVKCMAEGGLTGSEKEWMGGADATDPFILARMRAAVPAAINPQGAYMPNANPAMDNRDVGAESPALNAYLPNANPAMDNRDVGMRRPAPRMAVNPAYIPNRNPAMDNRDVGEVYRAANVEQDSGMAYPRGRAPVNQMPPVQMPRSYTAARGAAPVTTAASQNLRDILFGNRPAGMTFSERLAKLNKRKV